MKLSPHYLKRYKDLALLYLKYGDAAASSSQFATEASSGQEPEGTASSQLPFDLEHLGPTFVKLGQILSSRPDLVPERYLKSLQRLQDKVKPFRYEDVELIIERELGARINKLFDWFDPKPLAAASLGQVHQAALRDGRPVVVKVQRPDITRQIKDDFAALEEIARLLTRHTRMGQRYQLASILQDFEHTLAHELDYRREAANMEILRRNLAAFPRILVPSPIADYSSQKVLTMDFVDGTKITELPPLARLDFNGAALAEELFRAYLQQILVDGIFHADPHPGNILMTHDHRIALLDLGMVGHTTPGMQEDLLKLLLAVSEGESDEAASLAIRMSKPSRSFVERDFRHQIGQLVAQQRNSTLEQMDVGKLILQVARTAADTGLYVPTELSLLGKTLLQLDQVGRTLSPDFDPNSSVRKNASELLNQRLKNAFSTGKMYSSLLETKQFLGALPSRLNKILDAVGNAEVNVTVKPAETEFLVESAQKVANRITTGLVLAAMIVGAALLMQVNTRFTILGYPGFAMLCFVVAAGLGLWLVLSIFWNDHKSKRRERR
jgi:predicted unusual protein kinase regulating ubiquinone biosynthesis (AarF/ABC1/UbiB family)